MEAILSARGVSKTFAGGQSPVLSDVSMDVMPGEFVAVMGRSGAGKSTLLYALSGMDGISSGQVLYQGKDITKLGERGMASLRAREFGFVFQQAHLVSNLTLLENAVVAGHIAGAKNARAEAESRLERMGVGEAMGRLPHQVSGGEAQRAAIARAMMGAPGLLFADEPTGALNKRSTADVLDILTSLSAGGQTILMVTHDVRCAMRASRVVYLEDGRIAGEMRLCPFGEESDLRGREAKLTAWLSSLSW